MTEKIAFISGGDANYFPLILEWIHSVQRFPQSKDIDICILDAGLEDAQVQKLVDMGIKVVKAEWPCPIPAHKIRGREYFKACVCRPFLPKFFPGYDIYFWMDSDTWVQDWHGVDLFLQGARHGKMSVTSQTDRAYPKGMRVKFLGAWPWKLRGFYYTNARKAFGLNMAKKMFGYHMILAGAFCLRADAPHWERWQYWIKKALKRGKVFTAEQLSLGIILLLEDMPKEILPAWAHWLCEFKPLWDEKNRQWVEPYLPNNPLSILHLSGFDEMRVKRSETTDYKTLHNGETVQLSYRYPDFDGEKEAENI